MDISTTQGTKSSREKLNRETAKKEWDNFTYEVLPILKLTALSELKGGTYLMRLELIENKKGEIIDKKYVPINWDDIEMITVAINWILENPDRMSEIGSPFFMVSQRQPKHNFFESLLSRGIGKPTDELKIEHNVHTFSEAVERAKELRKTKLGAAGSTPGETGDVVTSMEAWL